MPLQLFRRTFGGPRSRLWSREVDHSAFPTLSSCQFTRPKSRDQQHVAHKSIGTEMERCHDDTAPLPSLSDKDGKNGLGWQCGITTAKFHFNLCTEAMLKWWQCHHFCIASVNDGSKFRQCKTMYVPFAELSLLPYYILCGSLETSRSIGFQCTGALDHNHLAHSFSSAVLRDIHNSDNNVQAVSIPGSDPLLGRTASAKGKIRCVPASHLSEIDSELSLNCNLIFTAVPTSLESVLRNRLCISAVPCSTPFKYSPNYSQDDVIRHSGRSTLLLSFGEHTELAKIGLIIPALKWIAGIYNGPPNAEQPNWLTRPSHHVDYPFAEFFCS